MVALIDWTGRDAGRRSRYLDCYGPIVIGVCTGCAGLRHHQQDIYIRLARVVDSKVSVGIPRSGEMLDHAKWDFEMDSDASGSLYGHKGIL